LTIFYYCQHFFFLLSGVLGQLSFPLSWCPFILDWFSFFLGRNSCWPSSIPSF
jgi:hypothetical protein